LGLVKILHYIICEAAEYGIVRIGIYWNLNFTRERKWCGYRLGMPHAINPPQRFDIREDVQGDLAPGLAIQVKQAF